MGFGVVQAIAWEVQWMLRYRVRKEEYDEAAQVCLLMSTTLRCNPPKAQLPSETLPSRTGRPSSVITLKRSAACTWK